MSASASQKQSASSSNPLWELIPKTCVGLLASIAVPVVVLFLVIIAAFGSITILEEPKSAGEAGFADTVRVIFGVAFFLTSYAVIAAIPCAGLFGLPAILIGWRLGLIRWWTCIAAGFFLSSIPGGLYLWESTTNARTTSSANGIQYWINGAPTTAGLIQYLGSVLVMGLMGALGGFSFWLIWKFFSRYGTPESS